MARMAPSAGQGKASDNPGWEGKTAKGIKALRDFEPIGQSVSVGVRVSIILATAGLLRFSTTTGTGGRISQ